MTAVLILPPTNRKTSDLFTLFQVGKIDRQPRVLAGLKKKKKIPFYYVLKHAVNRRVFKRKKGTNSK